MVSTKWRRTSTAWLGKLLDISLIFHGKAISLSFLECVWILGKSSGRYSIYVRDVRGIVPPSPAIYGTTMRSHWPPSLVPLAESDEIVWSDREPMLRRAVQIWNKTINTNYSHCSLVYLLNYFIECDNIQYFKITMLKELIPSFRSWLWHHRLPNVTTTEAQPRLWWHLGVCGVTAMTENEVSISILSWYHKINFKIWVFAKPNCLSAVQV